MNIIFDYLAGRKPFGKQVAEIITLLRNENIPVYMAPNAIIMGFAIMRQQPGRMSAQQVKHSLALFRKLVDCVPISTKDVDEALGLLNPGDLEDGFQEVLARKCGATIIISNDRAGFRFSQIEVMTSHVFLNSWEY